MFTLTQIQNELTMIIYQTHRMEKRFEAQVAYQYLRDLLAIAKNHARDDISTPEYIEAGEQILLNAIEQRTRIDIDFLEHKKSVDQINYLVSRAKSCLPVTKKAEVSYKEKDAEFTFVQKELAKSKETIRNWENGWFQGESLQNKEYRQSLAEIKEVALEKEYEDILALIDKPLKPYQQNMIKAALKMDS